MKKNNYFRFAVIALCSLSMTICSIVIQTIKEPIIASASFVSMQYSIEDPHNVLNDQQKEFIKKVFEENFPKMWEKYSYQTEVPDVTFIIDSSKIPLYYSGLHIGNGKIILQENLFSESTSEDRRKDVIIHELFHIAQGYKNVKTFSWLTEGLDDYFSSEYYSQQEASSIPTEYTQGELYDGYHTTAGFLKWIEKEYPESTMKLHRIMQIFSILKS